MRNLYRTSRRWAGGARRLLFPRPELAAWTKAKREADRVPRFTSGRIRLLGYDLEYVDLLTLCPQWHDLFVRETLKVNLGTESPRILDCGANVGLASLYFKSLYPKARVVAYEADPRIAAALRGNLSRNGCADVSVEAAAVWVEDGSVSFRCEGADSGTVEELAKGLAGDSRSVPSVRLRTILEREPVDLLKLDIEGAEEAVLKDCAEALENVGALLMELHELDSGRRRTAAVLDLLDRAGFVWSMDDLSPLPWRPPLAPEESAFAGTHLCWSVLVRAWRIAS